MKRYLYILCAVLMVVFASCSKSEIGDATPQSNQVTLKVTADEGLQTRGAAAGVDRFAIEVYTDATYATEANVFPDGTNKANNTTGIFTMVLDRTQAYYCLLWADKSGSSVYDITSLKAVALTGNAVEAWHGTKIIAAGTTAALDASLTRAVSKISLMETGKLKSGSTLKLNFSQPTKFNVADATTSTPTARTEESISIATDMDGTTTPVKLNSTDIFVLSSVATADLTDLTFKFKEEADFAVSQAPLKANFNTNIKGHYTSAKEVAFTVTADDAWGTPNNEETFPKARVGYFYYSDKSFSNTLNTAKTCIGIVYVVNPDGTTGKIVSLDEATDTRWSTENIDTGVTSDTDGASNTTNVFALVSYIADNAKYPAFAWCATKNTPVPSGISWYLPAKEELVALYTAYNGDATTTANATARTAFNDKLTTAGGTVISDNSYWSSTQNNDRNAWYVYFYNGNTFNVLKNFNFSVRVVSAF